MEKLVVLGGGESGVGAALLAKDKGFSVFLSDMGQLSDKYKTILVNNDVDFEEGGHTESKIIDASLVVKSPGIPILAPMVQKLISKGIEVISEIEFAGRFSKSVMACITGSNGKTTTTLLTCHILKNAGLDASLAGNVGKSLALQVAREPHDIYVVELSSFQLDNMYKFRADVAVLTNITPDHLDRYDHKFENYIDAKFRILQNMRSNDLFIYGCDCDTVTNKLKQISVVPVKADFTYSNDNTRSGYLEGNIVHVNLEGKHFSIDKNEISIKGRHNVYNAMCAIMICMRLGVSNDKIAEGLRTFPQVEHRLETCLKREGVTYINDSKATNVDSTWYALDSMTTPVVWIAGGTDKGNDYSVLFDLVKSKVKVLICMGLDNKKLIRDFSPICKVVDTNNLHDAVAEAKKYAGSGDTVLLSPCCASFDLFKNYENRGELFKAEVNKQ